MSNHPLLDDLLIEGKGNIVLSKKSPEYKKNRLLMFSSLVWLYVFGLLTEYVIWVNIEVIPVYVFLIFPSARLLHAWCTNIPILLYKEVLFLPKAMKLVGRHPWVKDKFYDLDYNQLLLYNQNFFSFRMYQLWGVKSGQSFRISKFTNLFNEKTVAVIAAHHNIKLEEYPHSGMNRLFLWKKYKEEIYWYNSYFYTLIIGSTLFLSLPSILGGLVLAIYILMTELSGKSIDDILFILGGVLFIILIVVAASYMILVDGKYHKKIKQFFLIKGITMATEFIVIHYRFGPAQEIAFDKIVSIKKEENKIILETTSDKKTLPLLPFYDLFSSLEHFYKKK
ncbi:MAG: hypothetical protein JKY03_07460 [Aureispira sp.]|nr:hypothetical protein [Aureispira sp.]